MITLLTGGARSGKSLKALELAAQAKTKIIIATAQALDPEMVERISLHQTERGPEWQTVEEPIQLAQTIEQYNQMGSVILVDCLTLWLSNLFALPLDQRQSEIQSLYHYLDQPIAAEMIFVTNELGMGLVPLDPLSREFRDEMGRLNQTLAQLADQVYFMVSGLAITLK